MTIKEAERHTILELHGDGGGEREGKEVATQ